MKHKTLLSLLVIILILPAIGFGQTVHQVAYGTDQISAAIAGAAAGDIIELTSDGGVYIETVALVVDKSLTIRAEVGLTTKPVIASDDSVANMHLSSNINLILEGIYFDGALGIKPTANGILAPDGTMGYYLTIDNCEFWDFGRPDEDGCAINGTESSTWFTQGEELVVMNCIFGRSSGEQIRYTKPNAAGPTIGALKDLYVYGCTFWGMSDDEAIYVKAVDDVSAGTPDPLFYIDHCTFVNNGEKCIYPKNIDGAIITNSIVVDGNDYACRIYGQNSSVINFLYYNTPTGISLVDGATAAQLTNILADTDPLFLDPNYLTSGNFELSASSPAIGQGTDGTTLGDPRWYPGASGIGTSSNENNPAKFQLHQNYPNPFNPSTTIGFDLLQAGHVTLTVYSILGQEITTLLDQQMKAGSHSIKWNTEEIEAGGIYFYKISVNGNQQIRKMILIK